MGELELLLNCFRTSLECNGHEVQSSMQCRCFTLPIMQCVHNSGINIHFAETQCIHYVIKTTHAVYTSFPFSCAPVYLVLAPDNEAPKAV